MALILTAPLSALSPLWRLRMGDLCMSMAGLRDGRAVGAFHGAWVGLARKVEGAPRARSADLDQLLAYGNRVYEVLEAEGYDEDQVFAAGADLLAELARPSTEEVAETRGKSEGANSPA